MVGGTRQLVSELVPVNGPVEAQSGYAVYRDERGNINASLNFVIPAAQMTGRLVLETSVEATDSCHGARAKDSRTTEIDVAQRNRLQLRGIPYAFQPAATLGLTALSAPTLAQFRADAALAFTQWPVTAMRNRDVTFAAAQTTTLPLTDAAISLGACSPNWNALLNAVNMAATNDGPRANTIYYGYIPGMIPVGPVAGCGSGGLTAGRQGDAVTMSHEIGHGLGRPHSPCSVNGDNNYTVYTPYDSVTTAGPPVRLQRASIGEFGRNCSPPNGIHLTNKAIHLKKRFYSARVLYDIFKPLSIPWPVRFLPVSVPSICRSVFWSSVHRIGWGAVSGGKC